MAPALASASRGSLSSTGSNPSVINAATHCPLSAFMVRLLTAHGNFQLRRPLAAEAVSRSQQISHPPLMLLMHLNGAREQVDSSGIVVLVGHSGCVPHLLDHQQQVPIGLFHH